MAPRYVLSIDQGTTGSTVLLIDEGLEVVAKGYQEFPQIYPKPGWVEHDPDAIWASVTGAIEACLTKAGIDRGAIAAVSITNQRETTVVWDKETDEPIHNAIVWQCRRTAEFCRTLAADPAVNERFRTKTGLVLDAYFSGTKVRWMLDHVPEARERAEAGELAFGTIDTYLVWRLTAGAAHVTDVSNASRTLMFDIRALDWDDELLADLDVPRAMLPEVRSSSEIYGTTKDVPGLPDGIPVAGIAGDQQAALFGQACYDVGEAKCTYGTGAFLLANTGTEAVPSSSGLLTTVAWKLGDTVTYALEGSVFIAGAAVQWLRDGLELIPTSPDVEPLARSVESSDEVVFVPALVGLGAPHWDPDARGAILGMTRGTTRAHLARATLEGIAHQAADVFHAMAKDMGAPLKAVKVDGGAAANDLLMQYQSDLLGLPVHRPSMLETTALGSACLAGLAVGIWESTDDIRRRWRLQSTFEPAMEDKERSRRLAKWQKALDAVKAFV